MARALSDYCERKGNLSDVLEICCPFVEAEKQSEKIGKPTIKGHVYLMRSGKYYKIGKSNHVGRREYQIGLQLPEPVNTIHSIATGDPDGIEIYWHNRFKNKRAQGEWFSLGQDDIRAFKARRFM
jgi:Meiotically up-regulated gene 113